MTEEQATEAEDLRTTTLAVLLGIRPLDHVEPPVDPREGDLGELLWIELAGRLSSTAPLPYSEHPADLHVLARRAAREQSLRDLFELVPDEWKSIVVCSRAQAEQQLVDIGRLLLVSVVQGEDLETRLAPLGVMLARSVVASRHDRVTLDDETRRAILEVFESHARDRRGERLLRAVARAVLHAEFAALPHEARHAVTQACRVKDIRYIIGDAPARGITPGVLASIVSGWGATGPSASGGHA